MKQSENKNRHIADAMDWDEAMSLIQRMYDNAEYRDCLLIASGCYLGLRISDLLTLKWKDLLDESDALTIYEKKTGKRRMMRVNPKLRELARNCYAALELNDPDKPVFATTFIDGLGPITRQRAGQIVKKCKARYGIKSAGQMSTHTLRKTFGRHVWKTGCNMGKGDEYLILLQDIFGHSSIKITRKYLGIRQEEILSAYDIL